MFFKKKLKQYQIWHLIDEEFLDTLVLLQHDPDVQHFVETHTYQYVATIETSSIEHVQPSTVHYNHNWINSEHVIHFSNEKSRSTTVGDIIIDMETDFPYIYCQFGWAMVSGFKPL